MNDMIIVITTIRKIFDLVETEQDIKDKIANTFDRKNFKKLMDNFETQGKIISRLKKFKQDEFDNWIYESVIIYRDIYAHTEIFKNPISQNVMERLVKAGFEFNIRVKSISKSLAKQI